MADGLYVGMAGAAARAEQLDSIADNLANAESPGFKASRPAFQSFLPARGLNDKVTSAAVATWIDRSPGATLSTDNPLDVIPEGDSFLGVITAAGNRAFTRNGKLDVDASGTLVSSGHPVVGQKGGPITLPPDSSPTIDRDGFVLLNGRAVDRLALFNINGQMTRVGPSEYAPAAGTTVSPVEPQLRIGELEMGNSTPLEAAVQMIDAQRQFETAMQAIQTYRRLDDRAIEMGRIR